MSGGISRGPPPLYKTLRGVLISGVFQGCPYFRGVLIQGCPYFRGVLILGVLISGVSLYQGCPYFRDVRISRCPYIRGSLLYESLSTCTVYVKKNATNVPWWH